MTVKKVECLVCHEQLQYTDDNTEVLIEHLNSYHTNNEVFRYLGGETKHLSKVVKWDPRHTLECPFCGKDARPLIKKRDHARKATILGNLFWCWPMNCFSFSSKKNYILLTYCPACTKYIGSYDPHTGKLTRCSQE